MTGMSTAKFPMGGNGKPSALRIWVPTSLLFAVLLGLWFTASSLQVLTDREKPSDWNRSSLLYLPSGHWVKPMALGYREGLAAVLWVRGVIYFGEAYLEGKSSEWLGQFLDMVTLLNPRFQDAYDFAGAILAKDSSGREAARKIMDRGISEYPENWQFRVYAALNQMKLDSNSVQAAAYLEPVATLDQVPNHIRTLAAGLLTKGGNERMALAYLTGQYLRTPDPLHREIFLERILRVYPEPIPSNQDSTRVRADIKSMLDFAASGPGREGAVLGLLQAYIQSGFNRMSHPLLGRILEEGR